MHFSGERVPILLHRAFERVLVFATSATAAAVNTEPGRRGKKEENLGVVSEEKILICIKNI